MRDLHEYESKVEYLKEYEEDLNGQVDQLEDDLMNFEVSLQEALSLSVNTFEEKVLANINDQKQRTIQFIKFAIE